MNTQLVLGIAIVIGAPALKSPAKTTIVGEWDYCEQFDEDGWRAECDGNRLVFNPDGTVEDHVDGG